jgi:hypothetical protein
MTFVPIAHFGHLAITLPVFLGPVVAVLVWISIERYRDRRS